MYYYSELPVSCTCVSVTIPECAQIIYFPTVYQDMVVRFYLQDKFGHLYTQESYIDKNGWLEIITTLFPPGFFTPFSGEFFAFFTLVDAYPHARLYFTDTKQAFSCLFITVQRVVPTNGTQYLHYISLQKYYCCLSQQQKDQQLCEELSQEQEQCVDTIHALISLNKI